MCPSNSGRVANIECTAKNSIVFHQITAITVVRVQFWNCGPGEPVTGIPVRPSSLYFHACRDINVVNVFVLYSSGRGITFYNTMGNNYLSFFVAHCNGTGVHFEFTGCPEKDSTSDSTCEGAKYCINSNSLMQGIGSAVFGCNATSLPTKSDPFEGVGGALSIIFHGSARRNSISFFGTMCVGFNRAAIFGGGMFIGHFDDSAENAVLFNPHDTANLTYQFQKNVVTGTKAPLTIRNESCLKASVGVGGGVSIVFCSKSHSNHVIFQKFGLTANTASLGGGGLFIGHFDNSSRNRVTVPENVKRVLLRRIRYLVVNITS